MPTTYKELAEYLGNKSERPYGNNTRIRRDETGIIIRLHLTDILTWTPESVTLNNDGWWSATTKARMQESLPPSWRLYQEAGSWSLRNHANGETYAYINGMTINVGAEEDTVDYHGAEPPMTKEAVKQLTGQINAYAKGYALALAQGEVPAPGNGDCFYCHMVTEDGHSLGEATNNTEHLLSHMTESYYVPSLLSRAHKFYNFNGLSRLAQDTINYIWFVADKQPLSDWQVSILERDVSKLLRKYLRQQLGLA